MKLKAILFWILAGISLLASNQSIFAETTKIKLECDKLPKVCANDGDGEFVIFVNMGAVAKKDSLYGFDFQLIYDSEKIQLTDFLTIGCLAEKCTHKNVSYHGDTVKGYATRLDFYALAGDKPLFAMKGKVKNNCIDSALIKIDYIEFTEEYTKPVEIEDAYYLKVERLEKKQNSLRAKFQIDTIMIKYDSAIPQELTMTYNGVDRFDNAKLKLSARKINEMLMISELPEGITKTDLDENTIELSYSGTPSFAVVRKVKFLINAEYLSKFEKVNELIIVELIEDKCKCIGIYEGDSIRVLNEKSSVSEIAEGKHSVHIDRMLRVSEQYKFMKLYNASGKLMFDGEINGEMIDLGMYDKGFYLAAMFDENHKLIKTIKIIKYSFIN